MANCADNVYVIKYTDTSKGTITIMKSSLITNLVDVALVGKSRRDYGEVFNESLLHLLENFACPAKSNDINSPDTNIAFGTLLNNPVDGQRWYNSTNKRMYVYDDSSVTPSWIPLQKVADVAGNSGIIGNGEYIPRPVGEDGYVFPYSECSFIVSQHSNKSIAGDTYLPSNTEIDYVKCFVSPQGKVTMQFRFRGESALRSGYANYQIIGIRGSTNTPVISVTPLPIPSPTPGVSSTPMPTPDPTPTPSSTLALTPTPTASPAASVGVTPTSTLTPTPTVSITKSVPATPAPSSSPTPTPSPVYSINLNGIPDNLDSVSVNTPAYATLTFNSDGTVVAKLKENTVYSGIYLPSGIGSNYELYYTYEGEQFNSDTGETLAVDDPSSGANTWHNLGTTRAFYLNDSQMATTAYVNITFTIRRVGNPTDALTRYISISADGECFEVGTKIMTPAGVVNIEDLAIGDYVSNFYQDGMLDESDENWRDWKTDSNTFTHGQSTVAGAYRFFANNAIDINGIVTTPQHIHFVFDGELYGWKNANKVLLTDKLVDKDGNHIDIINITVLEGRREFVAINVEDIDTLMVANGDQIILAHNISA